MRLIAAFLLTATVLIARSQDSTSVIEIYSDVDLSENLDVRLFINNKNIYPAPLEKRKKLEHTVLSTGTLIMVAQATNKPGYKSAVVEMNVSSGTRKVYTLWVLPTGENEGTIHLTDITDNEKRRQKLKDKADKWVVVTSVEDPSNRYKTQ